MDNQEKTCIKCNDVKSCDLFVNKWRPNICKTCLKIDAHDKYMKARVTKDMCNTENLIEKWNKLKNRRDKARDNNGKYICNTCEKSVALKYKEKHNITKYHISRLNKQPEPEPEPEQEPDTYLVPITIEKRNKETDEITETQTFMVTKDKKAKILEMLGI